MSDNPCPVCDKPIHDTAYVCHACARGLAKRLLRLARIWPAVEAACGRLGKATRLSTGGHKLTPEGPTCEDCAHDECERIGMEQHLAAMRAERLAAEEPPIPHEEPLIIDPAAIDTKDAVWSTLTTWARHVAETRSVEVAGTPMAFLARQADWLMHRREAEEALDELASACHLAEALVDNHGTGLAFCGTCDVCGRDMLAPAGSSQAYCRPCRLVYSMDGRRAWLLDQLDSQLAGAADLARALSTAGVEVKAATIRKWAERGRLVSRGSDTGGQALYAVRDVRDLVAVMGQRDTRGKSVRGAA